MGTGASPSCLSLAFRRGAAAVLVWGMALAADLPAAPATSRFEFTQTEMAVPIRIVLYAPDNATAAEAAQAALRPVPRAQRSLSATTTRTANCGGFANFVRGESRFASATICGGCWFAPRSFRSGRRGHST